MIEDCFMAWYEKTFSGLDPSHDDCYYILRSAYYAGWRKHMQIEDALDELVRVPQEDGDYEQD